MSKVEHERCSSGSKGQNIKKKPEEAAWNCRWNFHFSRRSPIARPPEGDALNIWNHLDAGMNLPQFPKSSPGRSIRVGSYQAKPYRSIQSDSGSASRGVAEGHAPETCETQTLAAGGEARSVAGTVLVAEDEDALRLPVSDTSQTRPFGSRGRQRT
jgi:hypothetical protein